jgi:hypothetical protein
VQWTVRIEEGFTSTYDQDNNGLEYGNSGLLSNYTGEMRTILRDYTRTRALASDTYYLFITPRADDNSVTGYMPRKKQAGFVFAEKLGGHAVKIIAHELAHGAFRLEHSFPELPENGNNLMDYSLSGTTLHKHQWDLIHDPVAVLGLLEDDEDNAYAAQIIQCISAAAIDMAMNYTFKWVELNFLDNDPTNDYSIMDFGNIWRATDKWEMFSSASISCATSIIPWPSNKAKLIGVVTASFGAGATALVADVAQQYEKLPEALNFKDKLSAIHWDEAFKKAGVQSLIAGISTGVVLYAVDHPKFKNFASKVKNLSYARIELLLKKSGFSDEAVDAFCKRFGLSRLNGAGSLAQSLTGPLKTSYNKLITAGLNAVEQGNVIKLFNAENKLVAEIANNKLVFKYSGYGGDIVMVENKSTAVFGRFNDPIHGGGTKEFIQNSIKVYETGANPNGINILNINDWTWAKNEAWVIESANRGDIIRFISDPKNPANIFKNGVSGEMTVTGLEVQTLENLGYVWDASKFQFIKP